MTKSRAVTTALTCSQRRLTMTASYDTLNPWDASFMFERDPFAFAVNNFSATLSMKKLAMKMERRFGTKGRMDAWTRVDMHKGRTGLERCCIQGNC